MKFICRALTITGLCMLLFVPTYADEHERQFGVVPQQSPIALASRWLPFLKLLSIQSENELRFATAETVTEFEKRCLAGTYDYAYMNALLFREAQRKQGYRAIARRQDPLTGIIVTSKTGATTLKDLEGATLAFPAPRAFGATLLPRSDLARLNIAHTVAYLGTHESAYRAVAQGQYLAAGGVKRSFQQLPHTVRSKLRILHYTQPVLPHVIAVHPRVDSGEAARAQRAILDMNTFEQGRMHMARLGFNSFVEVTAEETQTLDRLNLKLTERPDNLELHIIPRINVADTLRQMRPMAAYLKQRLELDIQLKAYGDLDSFEDAIQKIRVPAIINANPAEALLLAKKGFEIFAHQLPIEYPEGMSGVILVRKHSPYRSLKDLKGKTIAFGGNTDAFFSSVVPRSLLNDAGLRGQYETRVAPGPIVGSLSVLEQGQADAAGISNMYLSSPAIRARYDLNKFRILASSKPMPGMAWLLSPQISAELKKEIRDVLLNYGDRAPGHAAMRAGGIAGLQPANARSYAAVAGYIRRGGE